MFRYRLYQAYVVHSNRPCININVTLTTFTIFDNPLPFAQVYSSYTYFNPPVTRRFFENRTESLLTRLLAHHLLRPPESRPPTSANTVKAMYQPTPIQAYPMPRMRAVLQ